ncbi:hypothetical protein BV25DRAFT_1823747 [Artomyces pyxidatus]|uniref:Uncharacterized protein n=1 Tax=Artomyces pyxidatus TaxID=48021 RepID=A0ACB8T6S9_9AGAM|nr:hypothetical protein BV25DRAFT_1823747 [Artomyces pyxidatus]
MTVARLPTNSPPHHHDSPPMAVLPAELMIEIFMYCAHISSIMPLRLAQVCRHWKNIAEQTPRIFQHIVVDDETLSFEVANRLAHLYLERSRTLPFDVSIHVVSRDSLLPLLSPFLSHLRRWRSCIIDGAKVDSVRFADFWNPGDGAPKLEQLDLNILDEEDIEKYEAQITARGHMVRTFKQYTTSLAANLLFMGVSASSLPSPITVTPLHFTSLRIAEGPGSRSIRTTDLLNFLSVCHELEYLSFNGSMGHPVYTVHDTEHPPPIVSLPRLRSLVLHSTLCTRVILSCLYTPALVELYLEYLNVDFEFPVLNPYLPRLPPAMGHPVSVLALDHPIANPSTSSNQAVDTGSTFSPDGVAHAIPGLFTFFLPSTPYTFPSDYTLEDGDSDDEGSSDYSQSPYSDHATGMGVRSLIKRSNPPLRVLEMDYADMRTKDFVWLFSRVPLLTDFRIVASDMADRVIRMLEPSATPYCLGTPGVCALADACAERGDMPDCEHYVMLPRLRSLELIHCQRLSGEVIVEVVTSRVAAADAAVAVGKDGPLPLDEIAIVGCVNFLEEHEDELWGVIGDRLQVH